jgi:hypothetical protein
VTGDELGRAVASIFKLDPALVVKLEEILYK